MVNVSLPMKFMLLTHCRALIAAVTAVAFISLTPAAWADGYIGIDGSSISLNSDNEDDINPRGARLRLGIRVSESFDLEAHFGGGTDDSTSSFDELSVSYLGLYLKGYIPIGQRSALFVMAGGAGVELTQTIGRSEFSADRNGFSYGFGLETQLSKFWDLSADYIRYTLDDENFSEVSAVNLGLKWYF